MVLGARTPPDAVWIVDPRTSRESVLPPGGDSHRPGEGGAAAVDSRAASLLPDPGPRQLGYFAGSRPRRSPGTLTPVSVTRGAA